MDDRAEAARAAEGARRLVVFDFDRTLAADEVSTWIEREHMVDRAFGGRERVAMLASMLGALADAGVALAICSVNSREVIRGALDAAGLLPLFSVDRLVVRDRADFIRNGSLKSRVIANTILGSLGASEATLLFVDDDSNHVRDVALRLPQAQTILVPRPPPPRVVREPEPDELPTAGMCHEHVEAVLCWMRGEPLPEKAPSPTADASTPPCTLDGLCARFEPKKPTGPLARRCATCGGHQDEHRQGQHGQAAGKEHGSNQP
jgi:hypothetical protein